MKRTRNRKKYKVYISRDTVKELLNKSGITMTKLCKDCYLNYESVSLCVRREMIMPYNLEIIADYLGVSPSVLTEERD